MQRDTAASHQIKISCSTREEKKKKEKMTQGQNVAFVSRRHCYSIQQTVIFPFEGSRFMVIRQVTL